MPKTLFTELSAAKLKPTPGRQEVYRDTKQAGLILRVNERGTKSWRCLYYVNGKTRSEALGRFEPDAPDHMTVKAARDAAAHFRANQKVILSERAKQAIALKDSFRTVAEKYLKKHVDGKRRTAAQMRRLVEVLYPRWGDKPFEAIKRSDVSELLDDIGETRGPRAADTTLAILRSMMADRAANSDEYMSPIVRGMARIKAPKERARKRILSDDEIRAMFSACEELGVFGRLCTFLLYTGQRRAKCATMRWADLNGDTWVIATQAREKGNAERLKLPKPALAIIEAQRSVRMNDYVFPSGYTQPRRDGPGKQTYGSYSAFGAGKAELDKAMAKSLPNIQPWVLHDLRRTARSLMSRAGVAPHVAERTLGHAIGGVEAVYDRHTYDAERGQALAALAGLIADILEPKPSNVVRLAR